MAGIAAASMAPLAEAEPAVGDSREHFVAVSAHFVGNSLAVELAVVPLVAAAATPAAVELAAVELAKCTESAERAEACGPDRMPTAGHFAIIAALALEHSNRSCEFAVEAVPDYARLGA